MKSRITTELKKYENAPVYFSNEMPVYYVDGSKAEGIRLDGMPFYYFLSIRSEMLDDKDVVVGSYPHEQRALVGTKEQIIAQMQTSIHQMKEAAAAQEVEILSKIDEINALG